AVPQQAVRVGLSRVELPGRMQILPGLPSTVLDVAHNPHAAATLGQGLDAMPSVPVTHAVVGMYSDKDAGGVIRRLSTRVDHWHCVTLGGERGMSAESLADIVRRVTSAEPIILPPIVPAAHAGLAAPSAQAGQAAEGGSSQGPGVKPAARPARSARQVTISCWPDPVSGYDAARKAASDNDRIV